MIIFVSPNKRAVGETLDAAVRSAYKRRRAVRAQWRPTGPGMAVASVHDAETGRLLGFATQTAEPISMGETPWPPNSLRRLRLDAGLSLIEVARRLREELGTTTSFTTVARWERGQRHVPGWALIALADMYGIVPGGVDLGEGC